MFRRGHKLLRPADAGLHVTFCLQSCMIRHVWQVRLMQNTRLHSSCFHCLLLSLSRNTMDEALFVWKRSSSTSVFCEVLKPHSVHAKRQICRPHVTFCLIPLAWSCKTEDKTLRVDQPLSDPTSVLRQQPTLTACHVMAVGTTRPSMSHQHAENAQPHFHSRLDTTRAVLRTRLIINPDLQRYLAMDIDIVPPTSIFEIFQFYVTRYLVWVTSRLFQYWDYTSSDYRMTNKWWTWKDVKVRGRDLMEAVSPLFPGGSEENHEKLQWG
jgi:hypothetical protein